MQLLTGLKAGCQDRRCCIMRVLARSERSSAEELAAFVFKVKICMSGT